MTTLPPAFLAYWRTLCTTCDTTTRAFHELLRLWLHGGEVPGFGTRAEWLLRQPCAVRTTLDALPRGWSLANLSRYTPTKIERVLESRGVRIGKGFIEGAFAAAQDFRASAIHGL
jgi:hypothetical protein